MAVKEKNMLLARKKDGLLYIIKPYTSVHNVDGAVISVNGVKPVDGNVVLETVMPQELSKLQEAVDAISKEYSALAARVASLEASSGS